ncbi:MAG TPA: response regulator [Polyangiaceae bacterium]|nr:response regulator [Polyangiaceae bacterium]
MQSRVKDRILLVDDEPQVLVALEDLFCEKFVVFKSDSAEAALALLESERDIAVVITDQRMPKMTGDELLARLGTTAETLRILLTGYADLAAVVRAVNEGKIFAYVTKPWDANDLCLKVEQAAVRFRMANELAYERKLLHDLMDNVPDGIYFKDEELKFVRANRSFASILGTQEPGDLVGKRVGEIDPLRGDGDEDGERTILSSGTPALDVLRERRRGDLRRWLSETTAPVRSVHGDIIGLVGISRDVTERIETEEALRRSEEQLRQAQKMEAIGQLAGGIAHDFNNLLSVIDGYGQLVMAALPADQIREDVGEMLAASRRAAALTRQLLTFSRRQFVQPQAHDLNEIVTNVEKMLRRVIGENITLIMELSPTLGCAKIDAGQVEQVILNLAINARDAMPEGGKLIVETSNVKLDDIYAEEHEGGAPGPHVMLAVSDTGTGMDEATRKRIFEPFFTTKEVGKGTGLGLSTVYGIVQQSNGRIEVYSELGLGSSFKVYFPRVDHRAEASSVPRKVSSAPVRAATILLVEDDEAVRRIAARVLRENGHTVFEARRPSEARSISVEHAAAIDLLLTDIVMPEISGPRLVEELSATCPRMQVLYMSGYAGGAVIHSGAIGRGAAFLAKPFTPNALLEKVSESLALAG